MIRGVAVIDVSGGDKLWIDDRRAAWLIETVLVSMPESMPIRVVVGDKLAPVPDLDLIRLPNDWVRLATRHANIQVEGSRHLPEWLRFFERAVEQGAA